MLVDFTGELSSLTHHSSRSVSQLSLTQVQAEDSGNYTCQPAGLNTVGNHITPHHTTSHHIPNHHTICQEPLLRLEWVS